MLLACGLIVVAALELPARTPPPAASPAASRPAAPRLRATPAPTPRPTPRLARPPAPPGLSWEDADAVDQKLARIAERLRSGRPGAAETVVVTERQLNSYVSLSLGPKLPQGVSGLQLRLDQDRLGASAVLDLDRVKQRMPKGAAVGLLAFLSGTVPVELSGRVASDNGTGRVEIEQATVAGVSLPASILAQIVSLSTRSASLPQGFDLLAPFPLPWSARRVRLAPGRALVDFYQAPAAQLGR